MSEASPDLLIIAGGGLLILIAIVLVKFGKQILTTLLIAAAVVAAIAALICFGLPLLSRVDTQGANDTLDDAADIARFLTPRDKPPAPAYQPPQQRSGSGFGSGFLVGLITAAAGYFFTRWQWDKWQHRRHQPVTRGSLPPQQAQPCQPVPPVYYLNTDGQEINVPIDPSEWGW